MAVYWPPWGTFSVDHNFVLGYLCELPPPEIRFGDNAELPMEGLDYSMMLSSEPNAAGVSIQPG